MLHMISKGSKFACLLNRGKLGLLFVMSLAVSLLHLGCWGQLRPSSQGCQPGSPGSLGLKEAAAVWTCWGVHSESRGMWDCVWHSSRPGRTALPGVCHRVGVRPYLHCFSAEWLGQTCRHHPARSYWKFLLYFELVLMIMEPSLVVLAAAGGEVVW